MYLFFFYIQHTAPAGFLLRPGYRAGYQLSNDENQKTDMK